MPDPVCGGGVGKYVHIYGGAVGGIIAIERKDSGEPSSNPGRNLHFTLR